jgi:hypothetical protein
MPTEQEVLQVKLQLETQAALKDFKNLNLRTQQGFKQTSRAAQLFSKALKKISDVNLRGMTRRIKDVVTGYQKVHKYNVLIGRQQEKMLHATGAEKKKIQETVAEYKRLRSAAQKAGVGGKIAGAVSKGGAATSHGTGQILTGAFKVGGALLRKDLEGAVTEAVKTLSEGFSFAAKILENTIGKVFRVSGKKMWHMGDLTFKKAGKLWGKGGAGGKAGAIGLGAMGGLMKGVGKLTEGIGGLTSAFSKMGPALGGVADIAGMLVKLFMQIEGQAKDFNKEVLASADTSAILYANGMDADKAYKSLSATLDKMRDSAFDINDNMQWGITAQEHKQFEQTLFQEGVDLKTMKREFKSAKDSASGMTGQVQDWGDAVHVAVAFSRNWGVSLQEITQFQSEAMRDMGQSFDSTMLSMSKMSRAAADSAADSGIASNKFFAIIRGVSADLNLYNTRIDQATSLLKLMGKQMNPREAQKFMGTLVNMYKGMSEEDRIRQVAILGVGKAAKVVTDDLEDKTRALSTQVQSTIGLNAQEFQDAMAKAGKDGGKSLEKALADASAKSGKKLSGPLNEAITSIEMDYKRVQQGGMVGVAEAMQNLSAAGAVTATKAALQKFGGGKKLSDMVGIQAFAARKAANISQDQFDQAVKLEKAIDKQRDEMKAAFANPNPSPEQAQMVKRMQELGITADTVGDESKVNDQKIIAAMDETQQQALADTQKEINYAKQQTKLTSKLGDKLDLVVDGIMNYLYKVLEQVSSTLDEFFDFWSTKNNQNDPAKAHKELIRSLSGQQDVLSKDLGRLLAESGNATTASEALRDAFMKKVGGASSADQFDALKSVTAALNPDQQADAINKSDLSDDIKDNLQKALQEEGMGANLTSASNAAGLNPAQMQSLMKGAMAGMTEQQLVKMVGFAKITKGGLGLPGTVKPGMGESDDDSDDKPGVAGPAAPSVATTGAPAGAGTPAAGPPAQSQAEQKVADNTAPIPQVVDAINNQTPTLAQANQTIQNVSDQLDVMSSGKTIDDLYNVLWIRGIKINQSFMKDKFWKEGHDQVLDANREALLEYFLYKDDSKEGVLEQLRSGASTMSTFGKNAAQEAIGPVPVAPAHASGGYVTSIQGGVAKTMRAPAGEGFASVGPKETIGRAGGGGGGISINVNGPGGQELANVIKGHVMNGIAEYNRRNKFT